MKIILAFIIIWANGQFESGTIQQNKDWQTIEQCREQLTAAQNELAAQGLTTTAGCFEATVPPEQTAQ